MVFNIVDCEKENIYTMLSNIEGNYGVLNYLRLGKKLTLLEYSKILLEQDEIYYGDVLYYALKEGFEIEEILESVVYSKVEKYIG